MNNGRTLGHKLKSTRLILQWILGQYHDATRTCNSSIVWALVWTETMQNVDSVLSHAKCRIPYLHLKFMKNKWKYNWQLSLFIFSIHTRKDWQHTTLMFGKITTLTTCNKDTQIPIVLQSLASLNHTVKQIYLPMLNSVTQTSNDKWHSQQLSIFS